MTSSGPLATPDDLAARIGALSTDQAARAEALLVDASALIRGHCGGQVFTLVEDDVVNLRTAGNRIRLPQRPVVTVTQVTQVAQVGGTVLPVSAWVWDGLDLVTLDPGWAAETMQVTYSHGFPVVPDGLVAVACKMVNRVLTSPSKTDGLASETIGQYSYQAGGGGGGSGGVGVWLSGADKEALAPFTTTAATLRVRAW